MPCKRFCISQGDRLIDHSEWMTCPLEIFLRAHRMLRSFVNLLKVHAYKCCYVNYDIMPLHGALDVVAAAMTSIMCDNMHKTQFKRGGLFYDTFPCTRCHDKEDELEIFIYKVERILTSLNKSGKFESISKQIKEVLSILEMLPSGSISGRLRILSFLLKELTKKIVCCEPVFEETLGDTHMKLVLDLVNKFVRDWSEKRSRTRPCIRICRFCDNIVNETTRQWGAFCCRDAWNFNQIWREWSIRMSISDRTGAKSDATKRIEKSERERLADDVETSVIYESERKQVKLYNSSAESGDRTTVVDPDPCATRSIVENTVVRKIDDTRGKPSSDIDSTINYSSTRETTAIDRAEIRKSSNRIGTDVYNGTNQTHGRTTDKFQRTDGTDFTDRRDDRRYDERTKADKVGSRNTDGSSRHTDQENRQRKRDNVPYGNKLDDTENKGLLDTTPRNRKPRTNRSQNREKKQTNEDGERNENDRKISRKNKGRIDRSRIDSDGFQGGVNKSASNPSKRNRSVETSDDERNVNVGQTKVARGRVARGNEKGKEKGRRVGRVRDTDDEEKPTGRQGRKKLREYNENEEEMASLSKSKEVRERRKKKADALDGEGRRVSYRADEEGKVLKGDGKRKGRSTAEKGGTDDSDLMKKRKGAREFDTSGEDKSTLDSDGRGRKGVNASGKKGSRPLASNRTVDDDYSKINGSRYLRRKAGLAKIHDVELGPPNTIEYQLSNQHFVKLGWTVLPVTKTMRKIVQYQARTAKPHLDWFKRRRYDGKIYYDDKLTPFINFHRDGSGELFYPNGRLAIKVFKPKNRKYDMYTVFTPGGKDSMGIERDSQIVAIFDTMGNGAVFGEDSATRLSYNQIGGICTDNPTGLPYAWMWSRNGKTSIVNTVYTEKSTTRLEKYLQSCTERSGKSSGIMKMSKSPVSSRNKEKKVAEQKPVVEEPGEEDKSGMDLTQEYSEEDNCRIKIICMKLNEYISLRILDRKNINLQFLADTKSIRIELGTVLNLNKQVDSYFIDTNLKNAALKSKYEKLSGPLEPENSLYDVAKELWKIRKFARQRKKIISKYRPYLKTIKYSTTRRCQAY